MQLFYKNVFWFVIRISDEAQRCFLFNSSVLILFGKVTNGLQNPPQIVGFAPQTDICSTEFIFKIGRIVGGDYTRQTVKYTVPFKSYSTNCKIDAFSLSTEFN